MTTTLNSSHVKVGQTWVDTDIRTADRGKTGKAKPEYRTVEILTLPTLSRPGTMKVTKAPKHPHTIGKVKRFTFTKLLSGYEPAGL